MVKFDVPQSIESVIEQLRHIMEEGTFTAFMTFIRAHLPGVPRRDEGLFTKMAVAQFQNWQLDENVRRKLTERQKVSSDVSGYLAACYSLQNGHCGQQVAYR